MDLKKILGKFLFVHILDLILQILYTYIAHSIVGKYIIYLMPGIQITTPLYQNARMFLPGNV